ncbi:UDP-GlcNAc--UDP-phosphate GlcNAc-1-phosphate transferase [Bacteroidia bacterium]|nr:UDP-GlcNAc--UDP-phosphate GlcNAc-1-phosphate transferase [Bacteroidia bacterium]GHT85850.1 UDP-GlcNAc--UDP-phosphate GlcNAc-1-phosphate transferase [Bacteroidia bacterium]GHV71375.1 UDP-GlcNAc--UDP-phosphate GlcNAc-1-phosphate transferase [Bacteroidia bacterium]
MLYFFIAILLFSAMLLYFRIADKYNIIDKPNERSSHDYITIRGGGVVFWLAAMLCCLVGALRATPLPFPFALGITLISAVSFWDDIQSLPNKIRIVIHFLSISLVFYELGMFALPWWLIPTAYIFFVGILNAYNFMDGINGITGLYSLAVLILLQYINYKLIPFTQPDFINYAIIACMVFLFFNFRKKAKCFAGDVGSMAISFWLVTLLLQLMLKTGSFIWILFLAVYGVDSVCTILHRIYLKQNIFKAHRMHFYQILSNERGISHLKVSAGYALVQLLIGGTVIRAYRINMPEWLAGLGVTFVLSAIYLFKFRK